jgi:DNA-binding CsgD family transcriptional regulator
MKACELCPMVQSHDPQGHDPTVLSGLDRLDRLSPREFDVFVLLRSGPSNRDIAGYLGISERTVKAHLASVTEKLALSNRLQACMLALVHDLRKTCRPADTGAKVNGVHALCRRMETTFAVGAGDKCA